jgi:hypothetical protein
VDHPAPLTNLACWLAIIELHTYLDLLALFFTLGLLVLKPPG